MSKQTIVERIIEIGLDNGLTVSGLERECEITRGILNQAKSRNNGISTINLEKFLDNMPKITKGRKINLEYLLYGSTPKYLGTYKAMDEGYFVREDGKQDDFEERLEVALDNRDIQLKLKEVLDLSQ